VRCSVVQPGGEERKVQGTRAGGGCPSTRHRPTSWPTNYWLACGLAYWRRADFSDRPCRQPSPGRCVCSQVGFQSTVYFIYILIAFLIPLSTPRPPPVCFSPPSELSGLYCASTSSHLFWALVLPSIPSNPASPAQHNSPPLPPHASPNPPSIYTRVIFIQYLLSPPPSPPLSSTRPQ
jgi:hypothetical protein